MTPVTSYTLSMDNGSGGPLSPVYVGTGLAFNATGLQIGVTYNFAVAATNGMGTSPNSLLLTISTTPAPPLAPTNLTPVDSTSSSVAWTWTAPPSGLLPILNYTIDYSLPSPVNFTTAGFSNGTSFNVTGLDVYTTYVFQVAASNSDGMGPFSTHVAFRTNSLNPTVVNSTSLSAPIPTPTSSSSITIDWTAPTNDGGAQVLHYVLQVSNLTSTPTAYTTIFTGSALTYTHSGLWRYTTYQYRVAGVNAVGTSSFTAASPSATTFQTPPSAPQSVTNSSVSTTWMVLSWTSPIDDGGSPIQSYQILMNGSLVSTTTTTQYNVTGLLRSSTYNFTISAVNAIGVGSGAEETFLTSDCSSNSDCSGKGTCSSLGTCQCDPAYSGLYCESAALTASIDPGEFPYSTSALNGNYILYWNFNQSSNIITFGIVVKGSGWVGLGFGGYMAHSDIIMGWVGPNGIVSSNDYYCFGDTRPIPDTVLGGTNGIISHNGQLEQTPNGPRTTFKFSRYIQSSDPYDQSLDVSKSAAASPIILAFHPTSTSLHYHGLNREALQVNWASGTASKAPMSPSRISHGVLMAFGWLGLIFGALFARYTRWLRKKPGDALWFHVHHWNQIFWFVVVIAGFVMAFVANALIKAPHLSSNAAHSLLGIVVVGLALMQVAWAFLRPPPVKDEQGRFLKKQPCIRVAWQQLHRWIGRLAMILSVPTTFLGMYALRTPVAVYAVYGAVVAIFVVFVIIMELCRAMKKRKPKSLTKVELLPATEST